MSGVFSIYDFAILLVLGMLLRTVKVPMSWSMLFGGILGMALGFGLITPPPLLGQAPPWYIYWFTPLGFISWIEGEIVFFGSGLLVILAGYLFVQVILRGK